MSGQSSAMLLNDPTWGPSTNMVNFPGARDRILMSEDINEWASNATDRLEELVRLPIGWDGYQGQPVDFLNAYFALSFLNKICGPETPPPQIVPGSTGELQIEWHTLQGDIELYVKGPNNVRAWRAMANGDLDGEELDLTVDFTVVAQWVKDIMETRVGAAAVE